MRSFGSAAEIPDSGWTCRAAELFGGRVTDLVVRRVYYGMQFDEFLSEAGRRVRAALIALYGVDIGSEAASDAFAYAWEHWGRVESMANPAGYVYRVGQSAARKYRRRTPLFPVSFTPDEPIFEPRLPAALAHLSAKQRAVVILVHGYGLTHVDTARLLEMSESTVRTHLERGMASLRRTLEVSNAQ